MPFIHQDVEVKKVTFGHHDIVLIDIMPPTITVNTEEHCYQKHPDTLHDTVLRKLIVHGTLLLIYVYKHVTIMIYFTLS